VLVFLSGEREIRDAADALTGRFADLDVLPLYARLSTAEQQRVFQPHRGRRVVLATNVAETSLTVPGIKYVVDPGTARISRYSARLKVQRLPIEPVSQASADQRKGRCGRTSEGICIRLYTQEDFENRPRYTDPEILRTSLASVILQMAAVGLGDIEKFPVPRPARPPPGPRRAEPPDRARRARRRHQAHAARAPARPAARRPAPRPHGARGRPARLRRRGHRDRRGTVDPGPARAALRPAGPADERHARFADEGSDFLRYLNLWRYLREQQQALSGNQFRKRCKAEFLHYLRVREWQDLARSCARRPRAPT
jgi:ATP-dependent helicase HrpA